MPAMQELRSDPTLLGYSLPSDWYLRLGGEAARMLRGEIPLSADTLIEP